MELLLIRHALPLRIEKQDGTPADPSLSEEGHEQAAKLAAWMATESIDALYASPMRRARETAAPLEKALALSARVEPGVVEMDAQSHVYIPLEELKAMDRDAWLEAVQGGIYAEVDIPAFRRNVITTLERIVGDHRGERIAVVCHGGVINAWASEVLGRSGESFFFLDAGYTSISRFLVASSGERSLLTLNETAHLR